MSRYDGLIIPRSYSDYINKTDAATLSQALQLPGVMDAAPTENSNKAARSGGIYPTKQKADILYNTNMLNNIKSLPFVGYTDLPSQSTVDSVYYKEWIDYLYSNGYFNDNNANIFFAKTNPNFDCLVWGLVYGNNLAKNWSVFMGIRPDATIFKFGYNNGNFYFNEIT